MITFNDLLFERGQMQIFLFGHMAQDFSGFPLPQNRDLPGINPLSSEFARMVDTDHAMNNLILKPVAGERWGGRCGFARAFFSS